VPFVDLTSSRTAAHISSKKRSDRTPSVPPAPKCRKIGDALVPGKLLCNSRYSSNNPPAGMLARISLLVRNWHRDHATGDMKA